MSGSDTIVRAPRTRRSPAERTGGERLEAAYAPRRASAAEMRRALRSFLAEQSLGSTTASQIVLAVDEAFINAVVHAGGGDAPIRVSACVRENEVSIEVRDGGGGFTYRRPAGRSVPDVGGTCGRGVFLMESMMDEVSVRTGRRGTAVQMVKRLGRLA